MQQPLSDGAAPQSMQLSFGEQRDFQVVEYYYAIDD